MSDPGIQLNHTEKENIILEDIFVFPDLQCPKDETVSSKELLEIDSNGSKILISGPEDSGKTSLIKILTNQYLESGYYPIYIDIQTHTILSTRDLLEIVDKVYEELYDKDVYSKIKTQTKQKKAVFIDNFDKINCSLEVITDIIERLDDLFAYIILTEKTPSNITGQIQRHRSSTGLDDSIIRYEILEFGDGLRRELIHKWISIGNPQGQHLTDTEQETEKTKIFIDTVIKHNLVPSYPVYLLTILQMDSQDEDLSASASSYSHYYEYLIIKSLQKSLGRESIDTYFDLLSKLSFYMYEQQQHDLSDKQISSIAATSLAKDQPYEDIIHILLKADMLTPQSDLYCFKYKYAYHYFVAKYLSDNINSQSTKETIAKLCSQLSSDDSANIVLFITHLSDEPFLINQVSDKAESTILELDDFSTTEEHSEFDQLIEELSKLGAEDRKLKEPTAGYSNRRNTDDFQNKIEAVNSANNLIRIIKQILKK